VAGQTVNKKYFFFEQLIPENHHEDKPALRPEMICYNYRPDAKI
jgi:hypothetical protein